ncbi:Glycosyltransferase family 1 protein [Mycena indigotica]|uniref:Glycosyltransferase family 1 protein n=1 Tax=Mycena indigotica TaxID=2126181 RepID=A0A8H6S7R6_9AGAR|nr:Glycosyltransferase family 1 protein [Mycena indigotica]KAF7294590.1 Glycosyltransferase family 1 protein [Mycena indigotica]
MTPRLPPHMQEEEAPATSNLVDIGTILTNPGTTFAQYTASGKGLASSARVLPDGRIVVSLDLKKKLPDFPKEHVQEVQEFAIDSKEYKCCPPMNIVVMIVGSRGDVQPYVALGKLLASDGHRVRIATHETFRDFVSDAGLEFFSIGGDPQQLMSYMVKNPGLIPGITSLTNGDIGRKRKMLNEMISGCWLSCHSPCQTTGRTFAADALISNPPAFAHVHCAEALGIPLLMSFSESRFIFLPCHHLDGVIAMPWSPTTDFSHPLVNISATNAEKGLSNYLTYALADILTWQGVGDLINNFRKQSLGLETLSLRSGPSLLDRVKIPWTYCMSPALVPKPDDWKNHIDVVGFYFLDLATTFRPPHDLAAFLAAGDPPVYIGFGSVVVDDPKAMTKIIFEATKQAGVRALVSAGWGGLGDVDIPSHIFILGNVPHDWLFDDERVSAVVHHGGAGTTAIGLAKGRPTVVVPFFGDQAFWGQMIHKSGAGPEPIPHKDLGIDNLRDALKFVTSPHARAAAKQLAEKIRSEASDGTRRGVDSFYRHLPLLNMRCDVDSQRLAVWWSTELCLKLSGFAAQVLADERMLDMNSLDLHRAKEYETRKEISNPVTGGASAIFWTVTHYYAGIAQIFYSPVKGVIKTTTAIPRGVFSIVASIHEGIYNMPRLYGSKVRKAGKVTDFASGIKEGGKGLFYGYYDGITGLVREPYEGGKKEGFAGAIKGSLRSFANATIRPAGGIAGAIAHPINGLWKSVQPPATVKRENNLREVRISDGIDAVRKSTLSEKREIVRVFNELKAEKAIAERQKKYTEMAEAVLREAQEEEARRRSNDKPQAGATVEEANRLSLDQDDDDPEFSRNLERAKQLSLVEQ